MFDVFRTGNAQGVSPAAAGHEQSIVGKAMTLIRGDDFLIGIDVRHKGFCQ